MGIGERPSLLPPSVLPIMYYWRCYLTMTPPVRPLVCWLVGWSVGWLVGWLVCHDFLKGVGSYTSMLLSENIRCVTIVLNSVSESSLFAFKPNTTAFETLFIVISKRNAGKVSLPCANRSTC